MRLASLIILLILSVELFAQSPDTLQISDDKYVYLTFDANVLEAQTGLSSFMFTKSNNMISLRCLKAETVPTTLMVKTETDFYVWIIKYVKHPNRLAIDFRKNAKILEKMEGKVYPQQDQIKPNPTSEIKPSQGKPASNVRKPPKEADQWPAIIRNRYQTNNRDSDIDDQAMQERIFRLLGLTRELKSLATRDSGLEFSVSNIRVDSKYLYLKINLTNMSSIPYDIDFVSFELNGGGKMKAHETRAKMNFTPQYHESLSTVLPSMDEPMIYVLDLYSFKTKDNIQIKIYERDGRRILDFAIPAKNILDAKQL